MPEILHQSSPWASIGGAFGTGLGQGLQALAQNKLQSLLSEKQRQGTLSGLAALKFNPQEAEAISYLDPEIQKIVIKNKIEQPGQEAYAQQLNTLLGGQEQGIPPQRPRLTERQATKLAELGLQKKQYSEKQRASAYKETKEDRNHIIDSAKAARENDMRLSRIKELDKKGNIQNPLLYSTLKKVGLDIPALKNADSQELDKLSNDFLKSAKDVFGSRLTNFDVQTFLSTVPSLSNTKEGRARVIRNLELFNQGALAREKVLRDILKQNNNVPPLDLNEQVEEKVAPVLDRIAQNFKAGASAEMSVGSKLSALPAPGSLPVGTTVKKKDGTLLRNTGSSWEKVS